LLKVEAGSVSMSLGVAGLHGSHFSIQTAEDTGRNFGSTTVFARITEGIEAIQEYIKTDTIDDEQSENPALPLVPLRIKSLVITGEPEHGTGDSWQPLVVEQEIPDTTEEEKRLVKEAKDAKAKEESDKPDGGEESAPKKSDEPKK
jgi:hypothetical protein